MGRVVTAHMTPYPDPVLELVFTIGRQDRSQRRSELEDEQSDDDLTC